MNHFAVHLKLALHCKLYIFQILFPYRLLQDIEYSSLCSRVLVYLFLYTSVYMLIPNSYLSPAPGPTIPFGSPKFVFYAFLCLGICFCSVILFFFFTSHIWYHVIVVFLQLIWQSLGPSMLLQIALFHLYGSKIFHYIHVPCLLYPFICQWTFSLLLS